MERLESNSIATGTKATKKNLLKPKSVIRLKKL